jgi:hypothetical protein
MQGKTLALDAGAAGMVRRTAIYAIGIALCYFLPLLLLFLRSRPSRWRVSQPIESI